MGWFARVGISSRDVSERPIPNILQFVFLFFSIPCFKASNFFFEIAYTLQQRELVALGRKCVRLGGEDYSLQFDDRLIEFREVSDRHQRLRHILGKLQRRNRTHDEGHVWHQFRS